MSKWRNGLARLQQLPCYLQGPEFETHQCPVEFFACSKVSPLNNLTLTAKICAMCLNKLAQSYQGACITQNQKKIK